MELWDAEDDFSDSVQYGTAELAGTGAVVVSLWAGDEEGPAYFTPAAARKAADEWPVILRKLADEAERAAGARL